MVSTLDLDEDDQHRAEELSQAVADSKGLKYVDDALVSNPGKSPNYDVVAGETGYPSEGDPMACLSWVVGTDSYMVFRGEGQGKHYEYDVSTEDSEHDTLDSALERMVEIVQGNASFGTQ